MSTFWSIFKNAGLGEILLNWLMEPRGGEKKRRGKIEGWKKGKGECCVNLKLRLMGEKCRFDMYGFVNYHFAMSITIDQAGRIVIPKKMREKLNFENGSVLQCDLEDDSIRLKLADTRCRLTSKNGILVAEGDIPHSATLDVVELIKNQRDKRTEITCWYRWFSLTLPFW